MPSVTLANLTTMDPNLQNAYSRQANVEVEQQLGDRATLSVGYQYVRGREPADVGQPERARVRALGNQQRLPPQPHLREQQPILVGRRVHLSRPARLFRPASGRWGHYRISYTLSTSKNNVGEFFFSSPIDPFDLSKDWGRSDDDQRHRLVMHGAVQSSTAPATNLWERISHGFELSGMVQAYSALPFNITSGVTTLQGTAGRPIVDGAFIARNAGIGSDYLQPRTRGVSRTFRLAGRLELRGAGRRLQPHQPVQWADAEHELRLWRVPDEPVSDVQPDHGGQRAAVVPVRPAGQVLKDEPMMRPDVTIRTGAVMLAALAMLGLASAAAPPSRHHLAGSRGTVECDAVGGQLTDRWSPSRGARRLKGRPMSSSRSAATAAQTFGAPVQVNTIAGEARLGGELPPRVACGARTWIRSTRDRRALDGARRRPRRSRRRGRATAAGRSSRRSRFRAADAAGDRGWPSLALDSRGTAHAIWLDHRGLAAARVAGVEPGSSKRRRARRRGDGAEVRAVLRLWNGERRRPSASWQRASATAARRRWLQAPIRAVYAAWRHVVPGEHPGYRLHVLARRRPIVCRAHSSERGHAGRSTDAPTTARQSRWIRKARSTWRGRR